MRRIGSKDTKPELFVRRLLWQLGYRYRLHVKALPGTPDLLFRSRGKVIFVNGCFWHQHHGCADACVPKTRTDYWLPKLERNKARDVENLQQLKVLGWKVLIIWECQLANQAKLQKRLERFLGGQQSHDRFRTWQRREMAGVWGE
jgi:DNA mismatch endonuclease (patch repair protein)